MLTWDEAKRRKNILKHGIDFAAAEAFVWGRSTRSEDTRVDYGENRQVALGPLGERIHVLVYTQRGDDVHMISLRKANRKEIERYVQALG